MLYTLDTTIEVTAVECVNDAWSQMSDQDIEDRISLEPFHADYEYLEDRLGRESTRAERSDFHMHYVNRLRVLSQIYHYTTFDILDVDGDSVHVRAHNGEVFEEPRECWLQVPITRNSRQSWAHQEQDDTMLELLAWQLQKQLGDRGHIAFFKRFGRAATDGEIQRSEVGAYRIWRFAKGVYFTSLGSHWDGLTEVDPDSELYAQCEQFIG